MPNDKHDQSGSSPSEQQVEEFLSGGDGSLGDRAQRAWKQEVADYLSGKDCWLRRHLHADE